MLSQTSAGLYTILTIEREVLVSTFSTVVWWFVGLCLALALVVPSGYSLGAAGLLLLSLAVPLLGAYRLGSEEKQLIATLAGYFVLMALLIYLDGWHYRELDRPLRFMLAVPVLLLLLRCSGPRGALWLGSILGACGAFAFAVYDRVILDEPRAEGLHNAVMFGNIAMLLGLINAAAMLYFLSQRRYLGLACAVLGFVSGVMASLFSGTRGGWLVLPCLLLFLGWQGRELLGKRGIVLAAFVVIAGAVAILNSSTLGVAERLSLAAAGAQDYWAGKVDVSVGGRLEMWKVNLQFFLSSPIVGVGEYQGLALKNTLAAAGLMSAVDAQYTHAHNEYVDALGLRGLVGFAALLAVYLVPLRLFCAKLAHYKDNWAVRSYALAGAVVPLCFMIFALTQSMFSHNSGVMLYVFPVVFFWAAVRLEEAKARECVTSS